uniref:Uncharacterized protein n=1 Tax=Alexandrium monilatum TaxID=311494 RepID=A0A7S4RDC8_9DINO
MRPEELSAAELTPRTAAALPPELHGYLSRVFAGLSTAPPPSFDPGGEAVGEQEQPRGRESGGGIFGALLTRHGDFQAEMEEAFGGLGFVMTWAVLALPLAILFMTTSCVYFWCCVRGRPNLKMGSMEEYQFRALYIIPDSHRHRWRTGRCRLGLCCRCYRQTCRLSCCCGRRLSCPVPVLQPRTRAVCSALLCPCFRVPETWHVAGVLHFHLGALLCCLPLCCTPCVAAGLRHRLRRIFGIPQRLAHDFVAWCCCCFAVAIQEAIHVDGAAAAMEAKSRQAAAEDARVRGMLDSAAEEVRQRRALREQGGDPEPLPLEDQGPARQQVPEQATMAEGPQQQVPEQAAMAEGLGDRLGGPAKGSRRGEAGKDEEREEEPRSRWRGSVDDACEIPIGAGSEPGSRVRTRSSRRGRSSSSGRPGRRGGRVDRRVRREGRRQVPHQLCECRGAPVPPVEVW